LIAAVIALEAVGKRSLQLGFEGLLGTDEERQGWTDPRLIRVVEEFEPDLTFILAGRSADFVTSLGARNDLGIERRDLSTGHVVCETLLCRTRSAHGLSPGNRE